MDNADPGRKPGQISAAQMDEKGRSPKCQDYGRTDKQ
jgi:hypothetical protein